MTDDKRRRVLEESWSLFLHYGVKRTTMGDIAKASGMSRPTLYSLFDNKGDILRAAIDHHSEQMSCEIDERLATLDSLEAKLHAIFDIGIIAGYEQKRRSPHMRELFDVGVEDNINAAYDKLEGALAGCLKEAKLDLKPLRLSAGKLAHLLTIAARGMKEHARDTAELRQMLRGLIAMVVASAGPQAARTQRPRK